MARRRARAQSSRHSRNDVSALRREAVNESGDASVLPRVLVGAVNGVEIVAVGALQLARDVVLSTVSGAASIGAEALIATTAGARGVVSAASRMVGDIAETAGGSVRETFNNARHARLGAARVAFRRPVSPSPGGQRDTPVASSTDRRPLRRATRRSAKRGSAGVAA